MEKCNATIVDVEGFYKIIVKGYVDEEKRKLISFDENSFDIVENKNEPNGRYVIMDNGKIYKGVSMSKMDEYGEDVIGC